MSGPDYIGGPVWEHRRRREVRLAGLREYRGATFFDLRIWHEQDDGSLIPGKGATIPLDAVEGFHHALSEWLGRNRPARSLRAVE